MNDVREAMDEERTLQDLWDRLCQSGSIDETTDLLRQIGDLADTGTVPPEKAWELRARACDTLRNLTRDNAQQAQPVILEFVLPGCLDQESKEESEAATWIWRLRRCLARWVNQYDWPEREVLRDQLLDRLLEELSGPRSKAACEMTGMLGFRRNDVAEALSNLLEREEGVLADKALATLIGLGSEHRERLAAILARRISQEWNLDLFRAARWLPVREVADAVAQHWLEPVDAATWPKKGSLALRVLVDAADFAQRDSDLQDEIWNRVATLYENHFGVVGWELRLGGDIAPRCDCPAVVADLLKWLSGVWEHRAEDSAYDRYLIYTRLEECVRPRQLQGWGKTPSETVMELLRMDACKDSEEKGRMLGSSAWRKQAAWRVLLRLGCEDVLTWFEEGVGGESNLYLRQALCDLLACFRLDPLPPDVVEWVTETLTIHPRSAPDEWGMKEAGVQIARSTASREAFEALLTCGLSIEGKAVKQAMDALADVAIELARNGDKAVVSDVLQALENSKSPQQSEASAWTLEWLAANDLMPAEYRLKVAELISDESRDTFERSELVAALGYLDVTLTSEVVGQLKRWGRERDDWLGWHSLQVLARHDLLFDESDILESRLGLRLSGDLWDAPVDIARIESSHNIICILYTQRPCAMAPAVASLLRREDWLTVYSVVTHLAGTLSANAEQALPTEIREALIERIEERNTASSAEPGLFEALKVLAPEALVCERWAKVWNNWLADARVGLANALGEAVFGTPELVARAVVMLMSLAADGVYAVRRAAYRGLSRQATESFIELCRAWSEKDKDVESRLRAAEACEWLPVDDPGNVAFVDIYGKLTSDPEGAVRRTARNSQAGRREKKWVKEYLAQVCGVKGDSNKEVLAAWRYGQALARLGDDECVRALQAHVRTRPLPPHVRHWIEGITKDLQSRWRKVTQEWPEPWPAWEGAIESGRGTVKASDGRTVEAQYSLWHHWRHERGEIAWWGGAVWWESPWEGLGFEDSFTLYLQDGRKAQATAVYLSGNRTDFVGLREYPE